MTVNEYYNCWNFDVLAPGAAISVNAPTCSGFAINHDSIFTLEVEADEGSETFTR
ncbi:MAG: hypothetical protein ACTSUP_02850 [Candidatus Heimdallarchaeaceae archaeon]